MQSKLASTNAISEGVLHAIQNVLGEHSIGAGLHEPTLGAEEIRLSQECIESGWISYRSEFVNRFEEALSEYLSIPYVITTVSGTSALHLALLGLGVNPNQEVLIPSMTFVATANAIRYCGAIPHFVECSEKYLGVDVDKLLDYLEKNTTKNKQGLLVNSVTGRIICGIIPVHIFGHPVPMDQLNQLAEDFNLWVAEDAAESMGSLYKERHLGTFGQVGVISFNGNKILTTGGGGAVITKSPEIAERIRHLSTTAKVSHPWEYMHDQVGYNYRMPGINAAIGCAQLARLHEFVDKKRKLASLYEKAFWNNEDFVFIKEPKDAQSNYWLNTILLRENKKQAKQDVLAFLNSHKVYCRGAWVPMHLLPIYKDFPKMDLSVTEDMYQRLINLPSSPGLLS